MKLARCRVVAVTFSAFVAILYSLHASALGLGELTLNSGLNQPLDATIELLQTDGLDASEIRIQLGSQQDFDRASMERSVFLLGIEFDIEILDSNNALLHLTTSAPVIEPYLSFIIDARWPSGRMLREYTALIDLPVLSRMPAAPAQAPLAAQRQTESQAQQAQGQQQTSAQEPVVSPATEQGSTAEANLLTEAESGEGGEGVEAPDSPVSPETIEEIDEQLQADVPPAAQVPGADETLLDPDAIDEEYTVARDDTLWEIALQTRPNNTVSVHQMMLAIQRENPDAFISDNINLVREGAILRVPLVGEVMSMPIDLAEVEVARQNREFSADLQPLVAGSGNPGAAPALNDELSIVSGEDVAQGQGGNLEETIASLEMQLMLSEENLDRARIENQELSARLSEVDSQIELLDNIIDIESQRMAELQAELAAQAEAEAETAAEQAREVAQTDAQPATAPAPSGMQWLDNPLMLGGILAALILLVVGMLVLRRRRAEEDMEDDFEPVFANMNQGSDAVLRDGLDERDPLDEFVTGSRPDTEEAQDFDDIVGGYSIDEADQDDDSDESEDDSDDLDDIDDDNDEYDDDQDDNDSDDDEDDDSDDLKDDDDYSDDDDEDSEDEKKNSGILSSLGALMGNFSRRRHSTDDEDEDALNEGITEGFSEEESPQTPELEEPASDSSLLAAVEEAPDAGNEAGTADSDEFPGAAQGSDEDEEDKEPDEGPGDFEQLIAEADRLTGFEDELSAAGSEQPEAAADLEDAATEEGTAEDDNAFVEFNLATVGNESMAESEGPAHAVDEDEVFDFKLDDDFTSPADADQPEESETETDEIETFDFTVPGESLDQAGTPEGDQEQERAEDSDGAKEDDDVFDLGDLSFDENDAEDDDESEEEGLLEIDGESSRIDLAVAYEAMGDMAGAREILQRVLAEGDEREQKEARKLLEEWGDTK